ncbi:MAG: hypothetical protein MI740_12355 [Halanaerobiales bacterium]|nr:hypothetical protein [Halanaerobiales bacterium]
MFNKDSIDLKIILSFTNAYEELYEKGEITEEQLHGVLSLLEHYQQYSSEEFKKQLENIINNP